MLDIGRANRALHDALKLTRDGNYQDDRLRVEKTGNVITIYIKLPDGDVLVFDGADTELRNPDAITVYRDGLWMNYLMELGSAIADIVVTPDVIALQDEPVNIDFEPIDDSRLFQ